MQLEPQHREDLKRIEDALIVFNKAILDLKDHYDEFLNETTVPDDLADLNDSIDIVLMNIERLLK